MIATHTLPTASHAAGVDQSVEDAHTCRMCARFEICNRCGQGPTDATDCVSLTGSCLACRTESDAGFQTLQTAAELMDVAAELRALSRLAGTPAQLQHILAPTDLATLDENVRAVQADLDFRPTDTWEPLAALGTILAARARD